MGVAQVTVDHGDLGLPGSGNPFPPVFVAPVQRFDSRIVTIKTGAIREATGRLDNYLGRGTGADQRGSGNVIGVVGGYGTGKTHLLMHLLHLVRTAETPDRTIHTMYLDAPADTFLALYLGRFIPRLRRSEVSQRVRDYFADIVADSLEDVDFAASITDRLRSRDVDPRQIVERMGLMDTALLQDLQRRLRAVTRNDAFGIALTLLLRDGFESAVWEWFSGNPPDKILQERGITQTIDTEANAMEAIGVFAILYGSQDHGFVLMIDELEKVLAVPERLSQSAIQAFKKLLTVAGESGTFLVLSGLPDFLHGLSADVRQRIGRVIHTDALNTDDVSDYIKDSLERRSGERTLGPFTPDVVDYLTTLAGGNARRVIQLCHHAYRALPGKTVINRSMVRDAAREQFEILTIDDMQSEVRRVLDIRGWTFMPGHVGGDPGKPRVDYWIPVGEDAGCAVLLTDSVLYEEKVAELQQRVQTIRAAVSACRTLLVINGYLDPSLAESLHSMFTDEPLVYDPRRFMDDFDAALVGVTKRLEALTREDELPIIRSRMERLSQMQSRTQDFLERFAADLDETRSTSERRLGAIERALEDITSAVGAPPRNGAEDGQKLLLSDSSQAQQHPMVGRLPAEVEKLFQSALNSLNDLNKLIILMRNEFAVDHDQRDMDVREVLSQDHSRGGGTFYAVGVAALLQRLVTTFHDEVRQWYRGLRRRIPLTLTEDEETRLRYLCGTYESIYESLPVFMLDDLTRLTAGGDPIGQATRSSRRADIRDTLGGLSVRVEAAMLESLGAG